MHVCCSVSLQPLSASLSFWCAEVWTFRWLILSLITMFLLVPKITYIVLVEQHAQVGSANWNVSAVVVTHYFIDPDRAVSAVFVSVCVCPDSNARTNRLLACSFTLTTFWSSSKARVHGHRMNITTVCSSCDHELWLSTLGSCSNVLVKVFMLVVSG